MKKKSHRKLKLSRETLQQLEGGAIAVSPIGTDGELMPITEFSRCTIICCDPDFPDISRYFCYQAF